jgi:hypothetical protein
MKLPPPLAPEFAASPEKAKVLVRGVIEATFGKRICGIHMVDMQTHTEIEVAVSSELGPGYIDPEARSRALRSLLHAYRAFGHEIKALEPSADESKLTVKYSETSTDRLCWQFAQCGYCPRPASCRWDHVAMEVFVITLQLVMDTSSVGIPPVVEGCNFGDFTCGDFQSAQGGIVGYVPYVVPVDQVDQVPAMMYTNVPVPMGPEDISAFPVVAPHNGEADVTKANSNIEDGTGEHLELSISAEGHATPTTPVEDDYQHIDTGDFMKVKQILDEATVKAVLDRGYDAAKTCWADIQDVDEA